MQISMADTADASVEYVQEGQPQPLPQHQQEHVMKNTDEELCRDQGQGQAQDHGACRTDEELCQDHGACRTEEPEHHLEEAINIDRGRSLHKNHVHAPQPRAEEEAHHHQSCLEPRAAEEVEEIDVHLQKIKESNSNPKTKTITSTVPSDVEDKKHHTVENQQHDLIQKEARDQDQDHVDDQDTELSWYPLRMLRSRFRSCAEDCYNRLKCEYVSRRS